MQTMASSPSTSKDKISRKRGPNYSEAEKENLRYLAKKYNNIIESKTTGTNIFQQKTEAWLQLTKHYNASSTSGIRTTEQLKHLYDNMKQTAKKALAASNKADYLHKLEEEVGKRVENKAEDEEILDIKSLKFLDQSDKIARKKTGGGSFTPQVQDKDLKILELIKNQVEPLSNEFDSAASYFNDKLTQQQPEEDKLTQQQPDYQPEEECMAVVDIHAHSKERPEGHIIKKITSRAQQLKNRKATRGQTGLLSTNLKSSKQYKNLYFKKKYENAILERRRIYQDIRLRQKEHNLFEKEKKLQISILEQKNKL